MAQQNAQTQGGPGRGRGGGRNERRASDRNVDDGLFEKVININRVANVAKGGRNFRFTALVVVGDTNGRIGVGFGKAREVPSAVQKGRDQAIKTMKPITLRGDTIPHEVLGIHGAGRVMMRPASPGTGVKAGGAVRALCEALGIRNILTKSLGSNNALTVVRAAMNGLEQLRDAQEVRVLLGKAKPEEKETA